MCLVNTLYSPTGGIRTPAVRMPPSGLDGAEEAEQVAEVDLLVVPEAHVAAVGADGGGGVGHQGGHLLHVLGIHLIVLGADGEGADLDLVQAVPALPVLEVAGDQELALALHL